MRAVALYLSHTYTLYPLYPPPAEWGMTNSFVHKQHSHAEMSKILHFTNTLHCTSLMIPVSFPLLLPRSLPGQSTCLCAQVVAVRWEELDALTSQEQLLTQNNTPE